MSRKAGLFMAALATCSLLLACASPQRMTPRDPLTLSPTEHEWQGRLSVVVHNSPPQSMSTSFLLRGNASHGALDLYSPLGTTVAAVRWAPGSVVWLHGNGQQAFESLDALTEQATGAALPVATLFDWLQGTPSTTPGWQADLSTLGQGLLVARRTAPTPEVVLRLKID